MTKLHEKTLIDIEKIWWKKNIQDEVDSYDRCIKLVLETVKEWQIAKIKNCPNLVVIENKKEMSYKGAKCSKLQRCQSCKDRMKDHVITEEMLNG